ncbi:diguanylate cyclase [Neiella sp. HB171785]|uniref:Diguanylate cyclase n=1 Tax=Neiella litorisoli TaxID=2771431 RepID=A0A8J6QTQ7_9GAMM|nr:diguanylate cyclase [Neiella litorisoli]MBD1389047.1 diguanylate cyclase [Neiella litorisoli]
MIKLVRAAALILSVSVSWFCHGEPRTIVFNNDPAEKEQYLVGLLKLAAEKSGYGLIPKPSSQVLTDAKARKELEAGDLDVYWMAADRTNEKQYMPIRIPLIKGLLGYRIFIINQGDQDKFNDVSGLPELKNLVAGQGRFWGDTPILENAGLPLETSVKYENLFYMLEGDRFDYFPRAVHEPFSEITRFRHLGLTLENKLMLVYPTAMYFYVNNNDPELARALEKGLNTAISDGSFDRYFYSNQLIRNALESTNIRSRRVIEINNPYLPDETPLDRKELWLSLN